MALNFPSNPILNQVYTGPLGQKWKWNGEAWVSFNEIVSVPTASYLNGFELDLDVPPADGDLLIYNTDTSAWENSKSLTGSYELTGSFTTVGENIVCGSLIITNNSVISGSLTVRENLIVLGSASVTYISESTLNIGTNLITVNTINPGARFGGLAVIDSGSSPLVSASFLYDSVQDEFIFVHKGTAGGAITSSHFILGPETYNDQGNEIYLTQNRLPKGSGIEHLYDSNITDTGTIVSINSNTQVTGSLDVTTNVTSPSFTGSLYGTASWAESASIATNIQGGTQYYLPVWTGATTLGTSSIYDDGNVVKTVSGGIDIGLKLELSSDSYEFGNLFNTVGAAFEGPNKLMVLGTFLGTEIRTDDINKIIKTRDNNADVGLKLDFSSSKYEFGQITGGNQTFLTIDDATQVIKTTSGSTDVGLNLDFANNQYSIGNLSTGNFISVTDDPNGVTAIENFNNIYLKAAGLTNSVELNLTNTSIFGVDNIGFNGLKLDFSSSKYEFGQLTGGNLTQLTIDDPTNTVSISGSTTITGSLAVTNITDGSGLDNVVLYNTASGQFYYTSSAAIGGGDPFPYAGTAEITGSLLINTGSLNINVVQKLLDLEADIIAFAVAL